MTLRYAEVVVNTSLNRGSRTIRHQGGTPAQGEYDALGRTFHYGVPPPLYGHLRVGHMVRVPFGPRVLQGFVMSLANDSPVEETREIESLLDPDPVLTAGQIELARWMSSYYLAPLLSCVRQMLPPGLARRSQLLVGAASSAPLPEELPDSQRKLMNYLEEQGPQERKALERKLGSAELEGALHDLMERGLVVTQWTLARPTVRAKRTRFVELSADAERIAAALPLLGRPSRQADVLEALLSSDDPLMSLESLCQMAHSSSATVKALEEKGWVKIVPSRYFVDTPLSSLKVERVLTEDLQRAPRQAEVLQLLDARAGPLEEMAIRDELRCSPSVLRALEERGYIRRWQEPTEVLLQLRPEEARKMVTVLRGTEPHMRVLHQLQTQGIAPIEDVRRDTGAELRHLSELVDLGLVRVEEREVWRDPLAGREFVLTGPPRLTPEQDAAWSTIQAGLRELFGLREPDTGAPAGGHSDYEPRLRPPLTYLLHGVTGSGKTELYLHALQETLAAGRQGIVLVPEIALTPQTIRRFAARFPNRIAVVHSGLSSGERYDSWRRIRAGQADVVIGPRSALFAPLPRLGCIIVDEEHETSYKQERTPRYHAREVALQRAQLETACVILGSATPDLGTYLRALEGQFTLLQLPQRVMGHRLRIEEQRARYGIEPSRMPLQQLGRGYEELRYLELPPVEIVDLRAELRAGNRSIFSRSLEAALSDTLARHQQAILFLNRRGSATFILCRDCGLALGCPRCDVPLTYHIRDSSHVAGRALTGGQLICHHCGRKQPIPQACPRCASHRIRYFGAGTQRVEVSLQEHFPSVRTLRWDRDTVEGAASHDALLEQFIEHRADVLVGTQMVVKGLDLPLVTLVGVISADTALYLPDFRASERTFQLLTQVAGRAGRSILGGRVIIQTYNPSHYAIQAASQHDYERFYDQEIVFRRQQGYPPFSRLVHLVYRHSSEARCAAEAGRLAALLRLEVRRQGIPDVSVIGPSPCFFHRLQGRYRWQIVLRAPDPTALLRGFELPLGWQVDVDPVGML